VITAYFQI